MTQSFEVLVVGSGPAGLAAAACAAEGGKRVGLVDENLHAGGQIWRSELVGTGRDSAHGNETGAWLKRLNDVGVAILQGRRIMDQPAAKILRAESPDGIEDLQYGSLILATGARERFLPFPGWTLPNVMGAGGLQALVKSGLPIAGKRVVVAGTGPLLLAVAAYLKAKGAVIVFIAEQAPLGSLARFGVALTREPGKLAQGVKYRIQTLGAPFRTGCWPVEASGDGRLQRVAITNGRSRWEFDCDFLACGFHLVPNTELASLLGCYVQDDRVVVDQWQRTTAEEVFCAGEPTGIGGLELSLIEGQIAGLVCAGKTAKAQQLFPQRKKLQKFAAGLEQAFQLRPELKTLAQPDTLVCRCEDVPYAAASRHTGWRSAKLHTRCGMGPCQGRICGPAAGFLFGWKADSVRPPIYPALISSLAEMQELRSSTTKQTQEAK